MNIPKRLQKIGRDLQEVAMEMDPPPDKKGDYVRIYRNSYSNENFIGQLITDPKLTGKKYSANCITTEALMWKDSKTEFYTNDGKYTHVSLDKNKFIKTKCEWSDDRYQWEESGFGNEIKAPVKWKPPRKLTSKKSRLDRI